MDIKKAMIEIRDRGRKSSVISTVGARDLINRPKEVDNLYSWYSTSYLPLGYVNTFFENLKRWTIENKTCAKGAIIGDYGYGKTGTGIYLWKACETEGIIATPPFSWGSFQDLIDGIYGWVKYKLQMETVLVKELDLLYDKYREKNIYSVAQKMEISVENIKRLDRDEINSLLKWSANEIIEFLRKTDQIIKKSKYKGLVIFTDELQTTVEGATSVAKFLDDLFNIVNSLKNEKGNYSIIFEMPVSTEAMIQDSRGDIIDRLNEQNLYLKCEEMFFREFPKKLWKYYGDTIYDFESFEIVAEESLDSLYQIAFRHDLGTGPRSVIQAFGVIANNYLERGTQFSPIDLIDYYLSKEISFAKGGRLIRSVKEVLESSIIKENKERVRLIKLLAAFPEYGCPKKIIAKYGLQETLNELLIKEKVYGQVVQELTEGYTLTSLLKPEMPLEKTYGRIIREFARTYSEDIENIQAATQSFVHISFLEIFKPYQKGPQPIVNSWKCENEKDLDNSKIVDLIGSFSEKFPYRSIKLVISTREIDLNEFKGGDLVFVFYLLSTMKRQDPSTIEVLNRNQVVFRLNLKRGLGTTTIQELKIIPIDKVTPLLYLSLLNNLYKSAEYIPKSEHSEVGLIVDTLLKNIFNSFFGKEEIIDLTGQNIKSFGTELFKEIFVKIMDESYPSYTTIISGPRWEENFTPYRVALENTKLTIGMKRGKEFIEGKKDEICDLFKISSKLSLQTKLDNMYPLVEYEWGSKEKDNVRVLFKMHPQEEKILSLLKESKNIVNREGHEVKMINKDRVITESKKLGYLDEEINFFLKLLEDREFIKLENSKIFEVIHSIEDYKEEYKREIGEIKEILDGTKTILGIDLSNVEKKFRELPDASEIDSIEDYESFNRKIMGIKLEMKNLRKNEINSIVTGLGSFSRCLQTFIIEGLPEAIKDPKRGSVSWVSDLNECGVLLKRKYVDLITQSQKISNRIKGLDSKTELENYQNFLSFYSEFQKIKEDYEEIKNRIDGIQQEVKDYSEWEKVLIKSGEADKVARDIEKTYQNREFVTELSEIFSEIQKELVIRKHDALRDWEIYLKKIDEIDRNMKDWQGKKRTEFLKKKAFYEEDLKKLGVDKYSLRSNFDSFNPVGSFDSLYEEIREVIIKHIQTSKLNINEDLNRLQYFSMLGVEKLDKILEEVKIMKSEIEKLYIDQSNIRNEEIWNEFVAKYDGIIKTVKELEIKMRGLLKKKQPSKDEENILNKISQKGTLDLTEIIMEMIGEEVEECDIEKLMKKILSLYQKQQIIIKIMYRR